jgi:2,4-dienoyl-CoA reductase (NADPH2)
MPIGKRVVIIGGSMHGCETAEFLVKRGRKVTVLETTGHFGTGMAVANQERLVKWLSNKGVTMLADVKVKEMTDQGLIFINKDGISETISTNTVLITMPFVANTELFNQLQGKFPELSLIGDAKKPGLIVDSIRDGYIVGCSI